MGSLFSYDNYRKFLEDKYLELKEKNSAFSYRYFSKRAGFASPNFLKLVIENKRNLSTESIHRFANALKLNTKESQFFEILVNYNQAKISSLQQKYYLEILKFPEVSKFRKLAQEQYEFLSKWYHVAILELIQLKGFKEDARWIAKMLNHEITSREAKQALNILETLKLIYRDDNGKIQSSTEPLSTGDEAISLAAISFHKQILELASKSIEKQSSQERELGAITMAINSQQYEVIKKTIRDFRKNILRYLQETQKEITVDVYQLGIQFFRLTQKRVRK